MARKAVRQMRQLQESSIDYIDGLCASGGTDVDKDGVYLSQSIPGPIIRSTGAQDHGARFGQQIKPLKLMIKIACHPNDVSLTPSAQQDLVIPKLYVLLGLTANGNANIGATAIMDTIYETPTLDDFSIAFRHLNQKQFRVLKRWEVPTSDMLITPHISATNTTTDNTTVSHHIVHEMYYQFSDKFLVEYNSGSAGDYSDVNSNNFFLIAFTSNPNAGSGEPTWKVRGHYRLMYYP